MRPLTPLGFITEYVRTVSKTNTLNVRRLTQEAAANNPRLREPLFIYAVLAGKGHLLVPAAKQY